MKNNTTYQLYKGSVDQLRQLKTVSEWAAIRFLIWRFLFALVFILSTCALIISFLDEGLLVSLLGLFSDDPRFVLEGGLVLMPLFQLGLISFLLILLWINQQEIRIKNRNRIIEQQERLIEELSQRMDMQE